MNRLVCALVVAGKPPPIRIAAPRRSRLEKALRPKIGNLGFIIIDRII
jgi:hypothetical protein